MCGWQKRTRDDISISNGRFWFSYAAPGNVNEIVLGEYTESTVYFLLDGGEYFNDDDSVKAGGIEFSMQWVHVCGAWDSESGVATVSVNGEAKATKENFKKGISLEAGGHLVIGQEQDSSGGSFELSQSFVGELYNINVWDHALSSNEVASLYNAGFCGLGKTETGQE